MMLYLGIDQHARQITISLRDENGDNYWGLTPGCRNSGESDQRLGRITKAGSPTARWLLAQLVYKVLRRDARLRDWFKRIKRRRGAAIARVAVMRKLTTIMWHMLRKQKTYAECRSPTAA